MHEIDQLIAQNSRARFDEAVYYSSAAGCDWLLGYEGTTNGDKLRSFLLAQRASQAHKWYVDAVPEVLTHCLNSQLPRVIPEPEATEDVEHDSGVWQDWLNEGMDQRCRGAAHESAGVITHNMIVSGVTRIVGCLLTAFDEVREEAKRRSMTLEDQFRLWRRIAVAKIGRIDEFLKAIGSGFIAGTGIEMLHLFLDRSLACARQLLRALRAGARSILEALKAIVIWDRQKSLAEQIAEVLKKLAAAGLVIGGGLLEQSIQTVVIATVPWLAPVAELISVAIIVICVLVAAYVVGEVVDRLLCIERTREDHFLERALNHLTGSDLYEGLATAFQPKPSRGHASGE